MRIIIDCGFLKLDSGSHPQLYRLGMLMHKVSPGLWDYGMGAVMLPGRISSACGCVSGTGPAGTA